MERPVLYHDPTSEPSRAVHWFALEAGIELDIEYTWLTRGEHRKRQLRETGKASLQTLDKAIRIQGTFLGGDKPSIADFFVAADLFALDVDAARDDWFSECPAVRAWLEKLRKRDAYKLSHAHWNAIIPHVRELISSNPEEGSDPGWVADSLILTESHQVS